MRARSLASLASACLLTALSGTARAEPPRVLSPVPYPMPGGAPDPAPPAPPMPTVAGEFPCPPDPCPVPCRPAGTPRVRVVMTPPEIVFQQVPACAAPTGLRKHFPNCWPSKPECVVSGPVGTPSRPVGTPAEKPLGAPAGQPVGAAAGAAQAYQTVPVTTFHAVPVTTYQTVPVTTFHTVAAGATFGAQSFGFQGYGMQGFGAVPAGFGGAFGGFGGAAFGGGFGAAPMGFGAQAGGADFELRLAQALAAIAQQGKTGEAKGSAKTGTIGTAAPADDLTKQFLELEKRLEALTGEVTYNRKMLIDHEGRLRKLEEERKPKEESQVKVPALPLPKP